MHRFHPSLLRRFPLALLALAGPILPLGAATFTWTNATGNWSIPANWTGNAAPSGNGTADVLVFGGDVGSTAGTAPNYTATNDIATIPFQLNAITLNATDAGALATDPPHILAGNALRFAGTSPQVVQNGAGPITFNTQVQLGANLLLGGNGTGSVTFNDRLSGFADITKSGDSTFRLGTLPVLPATIAPSNNSWLGSLLLNQGTIRYNNNAESGRTALRANPVVFPASATGTPTITSTSELRTGTLSGTVGKVESAVVGTNAGTEDLVITALGSGTFAGTVRLAPPTGTGGHSGALVVRGPGVQTLTGTLDIDKDVVVGGTLVLAENASLGAQVRGSITLARGTFRLDNTTINSANRLWDAGASTGLDTVGGGTFNFIGNTAGSSETLGQMQLGALDTVPANKTRPRSGQLSIAVTHRAAAAASTVLTFAGYLRDATTEQPLDTVEFSAADGSGTTLSLGSTGSNPRVVFNPVPALGTNALLSNSSGTASTGWAVMRLPTGLYFATQSSINNGIAKVTTTATWASSATANVLLGASQSITGVVFSLGSLTVAPGVSQSLTVANGGSLNTTGILLSGANDYTITTSPAGGTGVLSGGAPRYIHVDAANLTFGIGLGNLATQPLVKSGAGTLTLTNTGNNANAQILAINGGIVRATPGTTLPAGQIRFRGGVLELLGGGTFNRALVNGSGISASGTLNWSTVELVSTIPTDVATDRGSGCFAAIGADVIVDLGAVGANNLLWEQKAFVKSGHALIFGSASATAKVSLLDNLSLTSGETNVNYNAREIRVLDNTGSTADRAVLSGIVSGTLQNDLLKTGPGELQLSAANTLAGTTIVQGGTLIVSGSVSGIGVEVMAGATLAGTGTVTNVLLESGGTLSPGDSSTATLTGAGLVWKAGGTGRFDLGAANASDRIALGGGALTKSGAGTFAFDFGGTGQTGQTYTLALFGSTTFTASNFTATNLAPGVTATFIVSGTSLVLSTVTPPIETWRQSFFGPGATNSGTAADDADPDFDGVKNVVEYFVGTDPTQANASGLPVPGGTTASATFTFNRNLSATDVDARVESTDSLAPTGWAMIAMRNAGGSWVGITNVTVIESGGGVVTVTDNRGGTTRFYQLVVVH